MGVVLSAVCWHGVLFAGWGALDSAAADQDGRAGAESLVRLRVLLPHFPVDPCALCSVLAKHLLSDSNIVGIICSVLTPYMLNPGAWNWGNFTGFFWVSLRCQTPFAAAGY